MTDETHCPDCSFSHVDPHRVAAHMEMAHEYNDRQAAELVLPPTQSPFQEHETINPPYGFMLGGGIGLMTVHFFGYVGVIVVSLVLGCIAVGERVSDGGETA